MFFLFIPCLVYFRFFIGYYNIYTYTMPPTPPKPNLALRYAGLATQWMVMLLLAVYAGYRVDKLTNWGVPLFLILFPLLSLTFSLWQLIKNLNKPH